MTPREKDALDFVAAELALTGGVPPRYEDIAAALGLKAKSAAARLVDALVEAGHLVRTGGPGGRRKLALAAPDLSRATDAALLAECARRGLLEVRHG